MIRPKLMAGSETPAGRVRQVMRALTPVTEPNSLARRTLSPPASNTPPALAAASPRSGCGNQSSLTNGLHDVRPTQVNSFRFRRFCDARISSECQYCHFWVKVQLKPFCGRLVIFEVGRDRRARRGKRERKSAVLPTRQPASPISFVFRPSLSPVSSATRFCLHFRPKNHLPVPFSGDFYLFWGCFLLTNPTLFFYNCFMSNTSAFFSWVRLVKTPFFWKVPCQPTGPSPLARPRFLIG